MGNTCSPDAAVIDVNMEKIEPSDRITGVIDSYQADNERMKKELDVILSENAETSKAIKEKTDQNKQLMHDLEVIRSLIAKKDRSLLRHLLEAALYSKVTSLFSEVNISKKLKQGWVNKYGRAGKTRSKAKWLEVYLLSGERNASGFKKGYMMLI